jgi:hypothetical protein
VRVFEVIPTPRELQRGLRSMAGYYRDGTWTYFMGEINKYGHWAYYPVCLATKTPIPCLILVLLGFAVAITGVARKTIPRDRLFILLPGVIYFAFAMHSSIQMGFRLVLPAVGFFVLVAAFGIQYLLGTGWRKVMLAALGAFLVFSTGRVFPHDIAYFNELAGGPENGWRYVSDSNIDWGQSYPELAAYMKNQGIKKFKLFSYGFDKPHRYFPNGEAELQFSPWTPDRISSQVLEPAPGIYAVPVSLLTGQYYEPKYRDYLRYFRERNPDGRAGYGIFIYYVPKNPPPREPVLD